MLSDAKKLLTDTVRNFKGKRIAVIGDLMLDSYVWGKVERISPEAPVPVVHVERRTCCLGGAANVMRNIVTLGGQVAAYGMIGADANGETMRALLSEYAIDSAGIHISKRRPTTEKQRIVAGAQQLMRIDYEELAPVEDEVRSLLAEKVIREIRSGQIAAVILEDYAKGLLAEDMAQAIVDEARHHGVIAALDPNPRNHMVVRNLTMMKPNRVEAHALAKIDVPAVTVNPANDPVLAEVAAAIRRNWSVEYLLISLAAQGMALFHHEEKLAVIPTRAREVYDVSGAGDTVIAAATLALAVGASGTTAAEIANHAAGIVVGKLGTVTVAAEEVIASICE